jgi:hypothetical protein
MEFVGLRLYTIQNGTDVSLEWRSLRTRDYIFLRLRLLIRQRI